MKNQLLFNSVTARPTLAGRYLGLTHNDNIVTFVFLPDMDGITAHADKVYWNNLIWDYDLKGWLHTDDIDIKLFQ